MFPPRLSAILLLLFPLLLSTAYGQNDSNPLELGQPLERELGAQHLYHFTLAAGECARVELQAASARLNLALLSEKNELIAAISEADAPGLKRLDIVAAHATQYFIRVASEYDQAPAAKYRLTLTDKRAATASHRERFALHILSWEVVSLYRQQEKSALQQAVVKAREAAARWQALGEPEWAGRMYDRAGRSLLLLSKHQESQAAFQQAIAAFQQAGARLAEAISLNNLATLSYNSGEYQLMLSSGLRAITIWQSAHDEEGLHLSRFQQAYIYTLIGEWQKAEDLCRQLLPAAAAGRLDEVDRVYREDVLMLLGMAAVGRGEARLGLGYLEEALILTRQSHYLIVELQLLQHLSLAWQKLGDPARALNYLQQSYAGSQRLGLREGDADSLVKLGRLYVLLRRPDDARAAFSAAVKAGAHTGKRYLSMTLLSLARFQHDQGELAAALAHVEQALPMIESLLTQLPLDAVRVSFLAQEREADELRTDLLLHLHERNRTAGYDAAALQASEAARARSLIQLISQQRQLSLDAADPTLTARRTEIRQRIVAKTSEKLRLQSNAVKAEQRKAIERELASLLGDLDRVEVQLREANPRAAALTLPEPLTLHQIQQQVLDRDTLLLEYTLGEERSFLFAVTFDALHTFILPSRAVIEPLARQAYEALSRSRQPKVFTSVTEKQAWLRRNERAYEQAAARLSALILKPAAALLGNKRLLIVPDGALHYVPFGALPEPEFRVSSSAFRGQNPKPETHNPKPLMLNHEIVSLPSASTLAVLRRESEGRKPAPKTLAIFADPVFDAYDDRLASVALKQPPSAPLKTSTTTPEHLRSLVEMDEAGDLILPRLPASRAEAEAIMALVPPAERKAALDFDASYQAVTQDDLNQYRFVHFATHGLLDEIRPELSGMLFSQVNRQGGSVNGFFSTLDAFQLKLSSDLVVLSGCRTALGKEVKGEGLMGLTRGFMYAGARRVAASLWQVNDDATAALMRQFYQGMLGEKKLLPAAALRAAQLAMWQSDRWHAPYYWAAFTLQGEW